LTLSNSPFLPRPLLRDGLLLGLAALVATLLGGCGGGGGGDSGGTAGVASVPATPAAPTTPTAAAPTAPAAAPTQADRVAVGEKLFNETALSAGGGQACATCHVKARGHADAAGSFLPLGGPALTLQNLRSSPSLNYLDANGAFRFNGQGDPVGGFTWDGRADTRAAQTLGPLLAANEMANADTAAVVRKLRALAYFGELQFAYGLVATASDAQVLLAAQQALADYQAGDGDFHASTSKYDAVLAGRATLTAQEARGLAAFSDRNRGACDSCHSLAPPPGQTQPVFTNFQYFALGVPRNSSTATLDPNFFDMGLCGPLRTDLAARTDLCGLFKVPTLRNVALTAPYFHNAVFSTLEQVVDFYATRDSDPARWYPTVNGVVQRFNDLPVALRGNVTQQAPFGNRGGAPRISPQDAADIVAFLRTLSDGFTP
jgi:cytochrome c peroxidase